MPTKIIRDPAHVDALAVLLRARKLPLTVSWDQGASRSGHQNRLSHRWYQDIARQLGDRTVSEVRAECKLDFGVPVLIEDNEALRDRFRRVFGHLTREEIIAAIDAFDLPVTRLMTVKQMTAYMDAIQRRYAGQGVHLTDPEALKYEQEFM